MLEEYSFSSSVCSRRGNLYGNIVFRCANLHFVGLSILVLVVCVCLFLRSILCSVDGNLWFDSVATMKL
jgi:hypothetical protein